MAENVKLNSTTQKENSKNTIGYSTDFITLIKLVTELVPEGEDSKLFLEDLSGNRKEIKVSALEKELKKKEGAETNKVVIEKVKSGIINHYEFKLADDSSKTVNKKKLKIVKPLEQEYPLINKHYLSIERSEKIIKMGSFYNNLFKEKNLHEFGFIGTSHESCPHVLNTLITLALYFSYHENLTVNLVLNRENINRACLHFGESTSGTILFSGREISVSKIEKINLIDIEDLANLAKQIRRRNIFQNFYNKSNQVTLWQVPSVSALESKKQLYFPLLEVIHNVSLVSLKGEEKLNNIRESITYFNNINIEVLGNIWAVKKLS